jgi:hypothetical protein
MSASVTVQRVVVPSWHPTTSPNGSHGHWAAHNKRHHIDRDMAWARAMQAGWTFVPGKVRLTIVFVYPRKVRVDSDNLVARCKGLIDGLKRHEGLMGQGRTAAYVRRQGFFTDDSTEYLELVVRAETQPGVKQLEIELEAL